MDKYHIYEEIGKGEFSQVFKGREKKKIEYVAIKRIEKSMMAKVSLLNAPFSLKLTKDSYFAIDVQLRSSVRCK